jgi:hypothetical protein
MRSATRSDATERGGSNVYRMRARAALRHVNVDAD